MVPTVWEFHHGNIAFHWCQKKKISLISSYKCLYIITYSLCTNLTEHYFFINIFPDSETTEDEGGDQFETKEDSGEVEDQAVYRGIHHVSSLQFFLFDNFGFIIGGSMYNIYH